MRRLVLILAALCLSGLGVFVPTAATPPPTRSLSVTGTGVGMYPAFDAAIARYAATTTAATEGVLTVTAGTSDPAGLVVVQGHPTTAPTTVVSGLAAGDEVSVIIDDAAGRAAYSVMYLPADFPALTTTVHQPDEEQPGLVAFTLNAFNFAAAQPSFETIVDRHGVPVFAAASDGRGLDLKEQPDGEITVSRPTTAAGRTGTSLVTLDDQLEEAARRDVVAPLTNTDPHDSIRLADGSTVLLGYEPNADTGKTDATIQKLDADGIETFRWTSDPFKGETMTPTNADYAHVNSVVSVDQDDLIVSFRHLSAIYRIATVAHDGYAEGEVVWKLGGRDSDFTFVNDPYPSGPCAQHTASLLPNGHLLVFDNGTDLYCVNPLDLAGPGVFRTQTRVTEYALDTSVTPHTASLVWSYEPPGKYSWFAGSARRMANGNTLMAWAADRNVLSTEVDGDGQKVWEIVTPEAVAPKQRYASYRAELIPAVPDRIAPTVAAGVAEDASYVAGDAVEPAYRCADRGGSNLQDCVVAGLTGGRIDTRSVGAHSWSITGTDGAGNTTTVVRHYTVRPATLADALIRKSGSDRWKGDGVLGTATHQTVRQRVARRDAATTHWRVQNDGERAGSFALTGTGSTRRVRVHYLGGGVDVTAAVVAGTYRTATLQPGQSITLKLRVTPTRRARIGSIHRVLMRAGSLVDGTTPDEVATAVTVVR
jgi:hypothetical protein